MNGSRKVVGRIFIKLRERLSAPNEVERLKRELADTRGRLKLQQRRARRLAARAVPRIGQSRLIWIFGAGRTGSTWLSSMMGNMHRSVVWFEPYLGELFDPDRLLIGARPSGGFVFAESQRRAWLRAIRDFVLDTASARFPQHDGMLIIKEPHGSAGAPLLSRALPNSRFILLVREPRDAIASALDKFYLHGPVREHGGWGMYRGPRSTADEFVERAAREYARHVGAAVRAYESHRGPKVLVRYEELLADTFTEMRRVYSELGIAVDEAELTRTVEEYSWANIPKEKTGSGKFYRSATPGSWKEDLTLKQAAIVEETCAAILQEFYA